MKNLDAECFIKFLRLILRKYKGSKKIYLIVDNAPGHRAKKVQKFLSEHEDRLEIIKITPYSPDLNEIEKIWREVKREVVYNTYYPIFGNLKRH
ncbi:MAG: transposase [Promethearchaeota archaeon]